MCFCGYLLAIPTLGLSLLCMKCACVEDAEREVLVCIENANKKVLNKHGITLHLIKRRCTSWLEFRFGNTDINYKKMD